MYGESPYCLSMRREKLTKKPVSTDWHPAVIVAEIWMKGTSLNRLSRQHRYATNALRHALRTPWPKGERLIAETIGCAPQEIWPSRYNADGSPKKQGERGIGRRIRNDDTAAPRQSDVQAKGGA